MKIFLKNFRVTPESSPELSLVIKFLQSKVPDQIPDEECSDYEYFYAEFLESYKELPDCDVIFPEDYLHIGLIVFLLWQSGVRSMSDIDLHLRGKYSSGNPRFDLRLDVPGDLVDDLEETLKMYYEYDRD